METAKISCVFLVSLGKATPVLAEMPGIRWRTALTRSYELHEIALRTAPHAPSRIDCSSFLATLSVAIVAGSFAAHGVRGQEKQNDSADATPLKVVNSPVPPNEFVKIAKEVGPAVVNINTQTLPKQSINRAGAIPRRGIQPNRRIPAMTKIRATAAGRSDRRPGKLPGLL